MDLKDYRFTESHEWVSPEGKVGISDHAQKEITDVVFVDLPKEGLEIAAGHEAGTIESVKAAFPIYAPMSGKVKAVNKALGSNPALVNQSPYEEGWIYQLDLKDPSERNQLMTEAAYLEFLKTAQH
jgi:glycine cleavage system H protein